jgi:hypothetical protein
MRECSPSVINVGRLFNRKAPRRGDLAAENKTNAPITAEPWRIGLAPQARAGWAAKSQQDPMILLAFQPVPSGGYFSEEFGQSM